MRRTTFVVTTCTEACWNPLMATSTMTLYSNQLPPCTIVQNLWFPHFGVSRMTSAQWNLLLDLIIMLQVNIQLTHLINIIQINSIPDASLKIFIGYGRYNRVYSCNSAPGLHQHRGPTIWSNEYQIARSQVTIKCSQNISLSSRNYMLVTKHSITFCRGCRMQFIFTGEFATQISDYITLHTTGPYIIVVQFARTRRVHGKYTLSAKYIYISGSKYWKFSFCFFRLHQNPRQTLWIEIINKPNKLRITRT